MATYGNGLNGSRDVYRTADLASNEFLRRGDPIESPLEIESPDATKFASLSVANGTGNLSVLADGDINLIPTGDDVIVSADGGQNRGLVVKPQTEATGVASITLRNGTGATAPTYYTVYNSSVAGGGLTSGNLQVFGYSGAGYGTIREVIECNPTGSSISLGDATTVGGAVVSVQGTLGAGRVYDTVYNKTPPAVGAVVASIGTGNSITNNTLIQSSQFSVPADGFYQYTAGFSIGFSDESPAPSIPAGILQFWVQDITAGAFSIGNSQVAITDKMMATRPTSTAITTYLTSPCIMAYPSAPIYLYAGANYRFRCAWWSDAPLAFGALGNQIGANLYAIN